MEHNKRFFRNDVKPEAAVATYFNMAVWFRALALPYSSYCEAIGIKKYPADEFATWKKGNTTFFTPVLRGTFNMVFIKGWDATYSLRIKEFKHYPHMIGIVI